MQCKHNNYYVQDVYCWCLINFLFSMDKLKMFTIVFVAIVGQTEGSKTVIIIATQDFLNVLAKLNNNTKIPAHSHNTMGVIFLLFS